MSITILYTTLPYTRAGKPRIAVLVSPRLAGGATLADFNGFVWPALAAKLKVKLHVGGAGHEAHWEVPDDAAERWQRIFPPARTAVETWTVPDMTGRPVVSYSTRAASEMIARLYHPLAQGSGTEHPPRNLELRQAIATLNDQEHRDPGVRVSGDGTGGALSVFLEVVEGENHYLPVLKAVHDFYRTDTSQQYVPLHGRRRWTPPAPPAFDFHQRLALLADYPAVLRRLGLVLDLDPGIDLAALPALGKLRVEVDASALAADLGPIGARTPWTRYEKTATTFTPAAGDEDSGAMLALSGVDKELDAATFHVYQVDLDGSVLKLAIPPSEVGAVPAPDEGSLAALRSGAITVARAGRGDRMKKQLARAVDLDKGVADELSWNDLTRGYRVDVELDGTWYSLCERTQQGKVAGEVWVPPKDDREGTVSAPGGTSDVDPPGQAPAPKKPLRVHEALFSWDGWSLVAQRPGKVPDDVRTLPAAGDLGVELRSKAVAGSLPRLRFGRRYRLRARLVDLAGHSLALSDETPERAASEPIVYQRYEPIPTPVVVPRARFAEGESLEHLVIRSAGGLDPRPSTDEFRPDLYAPRNTRHLAPPKATQIAVEQHGLLDHVDDATAFWISAREQGALGDRFTIGPFTGTYTKVPPGTVQIVNGTSKEPPPIADSKPNEAADATVTIAVDQLHRLLATADGKPRRGEELEAAGQYLIYPGDLEVPWLPDPLACGVALWNLRSADGSVVAKSRYKATTWPVVEPMLLALTQGPTVSAGITGKIAHVTLPPATMLTLRLSSLPEPELLPHHVWWNTAEDHPEVRAEMERGQHWLVSPWRELTFVHAVLRPLAKAAPVDNDTSAWQRVRVGDTFARIAGKLRVDGRSAGQVDLFATWRDPVDVVGSVPDERGSPHGGHVAQVAVAYDDTTLDLSADAARPIRHDFGDTLRHDVEYRADSTTRYREYFAPALTTPDAIVLPGDPIEVIIKSAAPPALPALAYVMPTFRWTGDATSKHRTGRGLRVWLERPWWSTGVGELLGVLLPADGVLTEANRAWVTQWGTDPRRPAVELSGLPAASDFANAVATDGPFTIPGTKVSAIVVGFEVHFDAERNRWYADLEIDTGSAVMPFIRLALCRWQPESLPTVELSAPVVADFVQVLPDRGASAHWGPARVTVIVTAEHRPLRVDPRMIVDPGRDALFEPARRFEPVEAFHLADLRPASQPWTILLDDEYVTTAELQFRRTPATPAEKADDDLEDLAWAPVPLVREVTLEHRRRADGSDRQWAGDVTWSDLPDGHEYRVVVRQYELYDVDHSPDPRRADAAKVAGFDRGRRLMFAAIFSRP